jgi:hypothetical protein
MEDDFVSIKEFAALIKMHPNSVRRSIKKGRLNAFRIGEGPRAVYRIARSEVNRLAFINLEEMIDRMLDKKNAS